MFIKIKRVLKRLIKNQTTFSLNKLVDEMADRKASLLSYSDAAQRFEKQVVLVTGATGSIGTDICHAFAREGATVVVCGRNKEKAVMLANSITEKGGMAEPLIFDLMKAEQIIASFDEAISKYGRLDVLINCAGGSAREECKLLADQRIDVIDEVLGLNLRSAIICSKVASKQMITQGGGVIINFSSLMSLRGKGGYVEYGAAKAGIDGLTRALSVELGPYHIRVNSVTPSYVPCIDITETRCQQLQNSSFLNSVGASSDISAAVLFLASKQAGFITGQNLIIDGGRSLGLKGD